MPARLLCDIAHQCKTLMKAPSTSYYYLCGHASLTTQQSTSSSATGKRQDCVILTATKSQFPSSSSSSRFISTSAVKSKSVFPIGPTIKRRTLEVKITELPEKFNMEWPKITFYGDSITRRSCDPDNGCWSGYVAHRVAHFFQVDVRGFDGYNSKWGLEMMPKLFPKSYLDKVEIFVPFWGHNDAWDSHWKPIHVPVDEFEQNMRDIIKYLGDNGVDKSKVILITPTWYDKKFFESVVDRRLPLLSKNHEDQAKYSEATLRIAKDEGIDVLDFFTISSKYEPFSNLFYDGAHLSREGARLLYDSLMPIIDKKIKSHFGKPIEDLWHMVPIDQHPEVLPVLAKHRETLKSQS